MRGRTTPLTKKEQVVKMYGEGQTLYRIVEATGLPDRTVRRILENSGTYKPDPEKSAKGKYLAEWRERMRYGS